MSTDGEDEIRRALEAAEEVVDPLDGLVERARTNPGIPFAPEVMARLADLKAENRPAYEALRSELKRAGVRVGELENAMVLVPEPEAHAPLRPPGGDPLIAMLSDLELFHTPDGTPYADVEVDGHRETWPVEQGVSRARDPRLLSRLR